MIESRVELTVPRVSQVATMCFIFDFSHCGAERSFGPVCTIRHSFHSLVQAFYSFYSLSSFISSFSHRCAAQLLFIGCLFLVANRTQLRTAVAGCTISLPARGAGSARHEATGIISCIQHHTKPKTLQLYSTMDHGIHDASCLNQYRV